MLQPLLWDSEQLNLMVAKILPVVKNADTLQQCLALARQQNIQLLYWQIPATQPALIDWADQIGGQLTDRKVTYLRSAMTEQLPATVATCYCQDFIEQALLTLSYASGQYSRFRQDVRLTERQFQTIYQTWMINSVKRIIADAVLVIYHHDHLVGMVTVGEKQGRGDIGLLAVAPDYRGQGIGQQLITAAYQHFQHKGYADYQVVTQQQNTSACRLYEKMGFHVEQIDYFYHLWL